VTEPDHDDFLQYHLSLLRLAGNEASRFAADLSDAYSAVIYWRRLLWRWLSEVNATIRDPAGTAEQMRARQGYLLGLLWGFCVTRRFKRADTAAFARVRDCLAAEASVEEGDFQGGCHAELVMNAAERIEVRARDLVPTLCERDPHDTMRDAPITFARAVRFRYVGNLPGIQSSPAAKQEFQTLREAWVQQRFACGSRWLVWAWDDLKARGENIEDLVCLDFARAAVRIHAALVPLSLHAGSPAAPGTKAEDNCEDRSAYRPASEITRFVKGVDNLKALHRLLARCPWIDREKPAPQRLSVHVGQLIQFLAAVNHAGFDLLDAPAEAIDAVVDALRRQKEQARQRKQAD
jgi:hypothetical protein